MPEANTFRLKLDAAIKPALDRVQHWTVDDFHSKEMAVAMFQYFGNTGSIWIETHTETDEDTLEQTNQSQSSALWQDASGVFWTCEGSFDELTSRDWSPDDGYYHDFSWAPGRLEDLTDVDFARVAQFKASLHELLNWPADKPSPELERYSEAVDHSIDDDIPF